MQKMTLSAAGLMSMGLAMAGQTASADFQNVSIEQHTTVSIGGSDYDVFRVYANFSDPNDRLVAIFGSPTLGSLTIESRNSDDTGVGGAVYNAPGMGNLAPTEDQIATNPDREWDTFGTIGLSVWEQSPYGNMAAITPQFPNLEGTTYTMSNGAWYIVPTFDHDNNAGTPQIPPPQTQAGWTGDGDVALRVLALQLTVPAGGNVRGIINIDWFPPPGQGQGEAVVHQPFQTFNSFTVPGPGSLTLLGLAALLRRRRR